jgi:hypothetical protein
MVNVVMSTAPLGEHSRIEQQHADGAAGHQRRNQFNLEPENGDGGFYRKQKRPGINACELRRAERLRCQLSCRRGGISEGRPVIGDRPQRPRRAPPHPIGWAYGGDLCGSINLRIADGSFCSSRQTKRLNVGLDCGRLTCPCCRSN